MSRKNLTTNRNCEWLADFCNGEVVFLVR